MLIEMDKILVTGSAGFIGMHLCEELCKQKFSVIGIDNYDNYYSKTLKQQRVKNLRKYQNFTFKKVDITNQNNLFEVFYKYSPKKVVNLAAQAGVRYSLKNPLKCFNTNVIGFVNVAEACRKTQVEGLIYASSSSVYGGVKTLPFSEKELKLNPVSLYGVSKISNELIASSYSKLYGLNTTGLRFFTVYGPWGRPDMAMYIFSKKILEGKPITVFNNGNMKRDFTYIDDIVKGILQSLNRNFENEIFNLGNNKQENLMDMINELESCLKKKANIEKHHMFK